MIKMAGRRSTFGSIRKLPSGRWQARYTAPTGDTVTAPRTFPTKGDARHWLTTEDADLVRGTWRRAQDDRTLAEYASVWLAQRAVKPKTRADYSQMLRDHILPELGELPLRSISPDRVREWFGPLCPAHPGARAQTYGLLKSICGTACDDDLIESNPCRIRGAGQHKRVSKTEPLKLAELETLVAALPERYRVMTLLAAWWGLRYGELTELRRYDVDTKRGVLHVRRGVTWLDGHAVVGTPKTDAGRRDVAVPPHLLPALREHLIKYGVTDDQLLFSAATDSERHLQPMVNWKAFNRARRIAGRPDCRFHDLRHFGLTMAAATGATLAELMARAGHSTAAVAMRYQHAAQRARHRDRRAAKRHRKRRGWPVASWARTALGNCYSGSSGSSRYASSWSMVKKRGAVTRPVCSSTRAYVP